MLQNFTYHIRQG